MLMRKFGRLPVLFWSQVCFYSHFVAKICAHDHISATRYGVPHWLHIRTKLKDLHRSVVYLTMLNAEFRIYHSDAMLERILRVSHVRCHLCEITDWPVSYQDMPPGYCKDDRSSL